MTIYYQFFESDGVTPAADVVLTLAAGAASSVYSYRLMSDPGGLNGDAETITDARIKLLAESGGIYVGSGVPIVDGLWARLTPVSVVKTGDPTMPDFSGPTQALGANSDVRIPNLPKNTGLNFNLQFFAPGNASINSQRVRLTLVYQEPGLPLALKVASGLGGGVLPGYRNLGLRRVATGRTLSVASTEILTIERGSYDYDGLRSTRLRETLTLNQTASDGALASGQSYIATISQPATGAAVATKGAKGASPTAPAVPTGNIFLGYVTVVYQAGGLSILTAGNLNVANVRRGDYAAEAGAGLSLTIYPGEGLTSNDFFQWRDAPQSLALTASTTNYVWRLPTGTFQATTTTAAPITGANLMWEVVTGVGSITTITDRRVMLPAAILDHIIELRYRDDFGQTPVPAQSVALGILQFAADLDAVVLDLTGVDAAWTAGNIKVDIRYFAPGATVPYPAGGAGSGGLTIYTGNATDDQRPVLAYNATNMRAQFLFHEVRRFLAGTRFVLDIVAKPTAPGVASTQELIAGLVFRRAA